MYSFNKICMIIAGQVETEVLGLWAARYLLSVRGAEEAGRGLYCTYRTIVFFAGSTHYSTGSQTFQTTYHWVRFFAYRQLQIWCQQIVYSNCFFSNRGVQPSLIFVSLFVIFAITSHEVTCRCRYHPMWLIVQISHPEFNMFKLIMIILMCFMHIHYIISL